MQKLFRFILILTFIGSGCSAVSMLLWPMIAPTAQAMLSSGQLPVPEDMHAIYEQLFQWPKHYFFVMGILYLASLIGAINMWRMRRAGFHIYVVAQLLLLVAPVLLLGKTYFNLGSAMITLCFIVFYFSAMKQLSAQTATSNEQVVVEEAVDDDEDDDDDE